MEQILPFLLEHWMLTSAFIIVLILLIATGQSTRVNGVQLLTADELVTLMNHEQTQVIDVRDDALFNQGHILHSRNISEETLDEKAPSFEQAKPLIIVGQTQASALRLASMLVKQQKLQRVFCLRGGINTWREANLPLTKQ